MITEKPSDYIQDGYLVTFGADGGIKDVQHLNPQQLATDATAAKVMTWLTANVPEGIAWTLVDQHVAMTNANNKYNCPCWVAQAQNGQQFNAGELNHNIFGYANPTQSVVDELHKLAA